MTSTATAMVGVPELERTSAGSAARIQRVGTFSAYYARQPNRVRAGLLTTTDRLDELAEILAIGVMRLRARKSSYLSAESGERSLDCLANQSGHANALKRDGGLV